MALRDQRPALGPAGGQLPLLGLLVSQAKLSANSPLAARMDMFQSLLEELPKAWKDYGSLALA
eukprot:7980253-Alexandrium_andersonii.AAC.1